MWLSFILVELNIYFGTTERYSRISPCTAYLLWDYAAVCRDLPQNYIFTLGLQKGIPGDPPIHLRLGLRDSILGDPLLLLLCSELSVFIEFYSC